MEKYIDSIVKTCVITFVVILSMRVVNIYEEKTRLEIEKLKYELDIYKESKEMEK